jgi:hypothetical protein
MAKAGMRRTSLIVNGELLIVNYKGVRRKRRGDGKF